MTSIRMLLALTVLTGVLYPLAVTGVAQALFADEASGSLVRRGGEIVGSRLVARPLEGPRWFQGRPSGRPNLGPTNPALREAVKARADALRASDPGNDEPIPADLLTASGSGLDPDISPEAALWQVRRVARARGIPEERVRALVERSVEGGGAGGLLGPRRVNVLLLNLALDALAEG